MDVATPTPGALAQSRRRIGVAPLRRLFDLLRGPAAGLSSKEVLARQAGDPDRWHLLSCADTTANPGVYQRGGYQGGTGYPLIRVLALMACGTRTIIDATFGTDRVGEARYAHRLLPAMRARMIVLADRNFAAATLLARWPTPAPTSWFGGKIGLNLPVARRLPDGI